MVSPVIDTVMFQILAFWINFEGTKIIFKIFAISLDFEGAKNIHVLSVLVCGFGGFWRFQAGVWHLDLKWMFI